MITKDIGKYIGLSVKAYYQLEWLLARFSSYGSFCQVNIISKGIIFLLGLILLLWSWWYNNISVLILDSDALINQFSQDISCCCVVSLLFFLFCNSSHPLLQCFFLQSCLLLFSLDLILCFSSLCSHL